MVQQPPPPLPTGSPLIAALATPPPLARSGLWQSGGLVGKAATIFTSTATQNGGNEVTVLSTIPFLAHHGVMFVPPGYTCDRE